MKRVIKTLATLTLATAPAHAYEWTDWLDRDDPQSGGDYERLADHIADLGIECDTVVDIQARRIIDGTLAEYTGEVFTLNTEDGFQCDNADQSDGWCQDYEVRFACAQWSAWFDRDNSGMFNSDWEGISGHTNDGNIDCDSVAEVQARRVSDQVDASETGETIRLNTSHGFVCKHQWQSDYTCDDYEVRFMCQAELETAASVEGFADQFTLDDFGDIAPPEYSGDSLNGIRLAQVQDVYASVEASIRLDESGRPQLESSSGAWGTYDVLGLAGDLESLGVWAVTGTVSTDSNGTSFDVSGFNDPLVFVQVGSSNGGDAVVAGASVRSNGDGHTVSVTLYEPSYEDGNHTKDETVHYLVIEEGTYVLDDYGRTLSATRLDPDSVVDGDAYSNVDIDEFVPGDTYAVIPESAFGTQLDDDAVVIARPQDGDGWRSLRVTKTSADGELQSISVRLDDQSAAMTEIGVLVLSDDYRTVEFDDTVLSECSPFATERTGDQLAVSSGSYGDDTIGASHYLAAGIEQQDGQMWAGGAANLNATLFGHEETLFGMELSASEDDGAGTSRMYLEVMGDVQVDDAIGVNADWSTSQTFFSASASFYGVSVSGEMVGTLGAEAGATIAGDGIAVGGTPYADITASASAGIGAWCLSAGVGADLSIASISVPTEAQLGIDGDDIAWSVTSQVEMSTLDGTIYLYVDYCVASDEYEIFSWDGIEIPTVELIDASGCF